MTKLLVVDSITHKYFIKISLNTNLFDEMHNIYKFKTFTSNLKLHWTHC